MTDAHMMARISDPNTSHEAAHSFNPTRMEAMILEAIAKFPDGCIADNIRILFPHIRRHTIVPRFAPLLRSGCIVDTGERRKAASGRKQRVVKFVPEPERVAGFQKPKKIKWVGLTDDEIKEIIGPWGDTPIKGYTRKLFDQIEAKLREKNGG